MAQLRDPFVSILLVVVVGALCGLAVEKFLPRSWFATRMAGGQSTLTHILVGIAGSFIGFHLAMLTTASSVNALVPFIAAAVVSLLILWGWRNARF
jgi:uncharacterized membrane protein YeaQ/YmgE (transglycosylase-associated protein family)